jgi:hypothetical protein
MPPNRTRQALAARKHLDLLQTDRADLNRGTGRWQHTPQGHAAQHLTHPEQQLQQAKARAADAPLWRRPQANRHVRDLANALAHAEDQWAIIAAPAARGLDHQINTAQTQIGQLEQASDAHYRWLRAHPDTARAIHHVSQQLEAVDQPAPSRHPASRRHHPSPPAGR